MNPVIWIITGKRSSVSIIMKYQEIAAVAITALMPGVKTVSIFLPSRNVIAVIPAKPGARHVLTTAISHKPVTLAIMAHKVKAKTQLIFQPQKIVNVVT